MSWAYDPGGRTRAGVKDKRRGQRTRVSNIKVSTFGKHPVTLWRICGPSYLQPTPCWYLLSSRCHKLHNDHLKHAGSGYAITPNAPIRMGCVGDSRSVVIILTSVSR